MDSHLNQIKYILSFFAVVLLAYLLKILSTILIPLVLAFFIALLFYPFVKWLVSKKVPYWASVLLIIGFIFFTGDFIIEMLIKSVSNFTSSQQELTDKVELKFQPILELFNQYFQLDFKQTYELIGPYVIKYIPTNWVLELASMGFITLLYLIFILSGNILNMESSVSGLLEGNSANTRANWVDAFKTIRSSISKYMIVKAAVSFLTGLGYTITCWAFGIEFAVLWGFLAFILNFIPNFGSLMATIPPLLLGWIGIDSPSMLMLFFAILIVIQQVLGNVLEPVWMGKSFSLNTIAVLFGLVLCTYIWGIIGAVLAVPIMVVTKVILMQIPGTELIVKLMSVREKPKKKKVIAEEPTSD